MQGRLHLHTPRTPIMNTRHLQYRPHLLKSKRFRSVRNFKMIENALDEGTLKQYLADDPPTVVLLAIKPHFQALNDKEKKYAHYISRAAFSGTRINLRYEQRSTLDKRSLCLRECRQVSPESEAIYDFILALQKTCKGRVKYQHRLPTTTLRQLIKLRIIIMLRLIEYR